MEIRIKTAESVNDISILRTYAPHNGYEVEIIKNTGIRQVHISLIPRKYIKIRCADNNGQIRMA